MKKKILLIITIILIGSFGINVNAETTVKIYDTKLTSNNYVVVPSGTRIININDDTVYGQYGSGEVPPQYYIGTFCTDSSNISNWEGTSMNSSGGSGTTYENTLVQLNFYNTKYTCTFPNSTYTGHIVYIYGQINPILSTSATTMYLMGRISFTQPSQASWSLLSWSFSNDTLDIDYANDTVISQNQTIIVQNTQIIQGQQNIINNNNSNTNSIINNQNANSQAEIQNANENTDRTIESQKVCSNYDKTAIEIDNIFLNSSGNTVSNNYFGVSGYFTINKDAELKVLQKSTNGLASLCFYNTNKTLISCIVNNNMNNNANLTIPSNADYFRFSIDKGLNLPQLQVCKNGNQAIGDSLNDLYNSDIPDIDKQLPDSSSFNDYHDAESSLKDKISEADMSVLDIGIDTNSSNWVWNTLTSLIQSHSAIFGMFISILSIGIIKLALGR